MENRLSFNWQISTHSTLTILRNRFFLRSAWYLNKNHTRLMSVGIYIICIAGEGYYNLTKTSTQWTSGSQMYLNNEKIIFGQKLFLQKKIKKGTNHAWFMPNYSCHKRHLHRFAAYCLTKASYEIALSSLKRCFE